MKVSEMNLDADLSQQISEHIISETQGSEYIIDCYPYAMKGFLWGLVFSAVLWMGVIGVLLLVF
ncbi:hypothetical protein DSM106972_060840 [Dulcicalothrix desertica PCC 7102]|uniref:Uncharacterized protein n=1 Tax=Dulcicalothrix desertica PCC 7102 TaxID=232991 RepID=A0A433V7I5_9CYAN|nr:hypothetical protein [Dulcicalothrix desertica]RUT02009.1 hypothetical protein DSM106972_060840 [Dulcicalothrix desertica PCC 7102]TWH53659.1 hypothetical protein CAL7102_01634 [Dulcicalothrix desertica PCC 7102]